MARKNGSKDSKTAIALEDVLDTQRQIAQLESWGLRVSERDRAITNAVEYCMHSRLRRKFTSLDEDDVASTIAMTCVLAYDVYNRQPKHTASFNSYCFGACKRALLDLLGVGVITLSRAKRRAGARAKVVSLDGSKNPDALMDEAM